MARTQMITNLNSDPNCVVMGFIMNEPCSEMRGYFDGTYENYATRLGPYIQKDEFEKHMAAINKVCADLHVGMGLACLCGCLIIGTCWVVYASRRWVNAVDRLMKEDINPKLKAANIPVAFEFRRELYGPYLTVRILVPVQQQPVQVVIVQQPMGQQMQMQPQQQMMYAPQMQMQPMQQTMGAGFCPKCGTQRMDTSSAFCGKCGQQFG
jgi:hypothetical protein